jgi:hypothetical protein
MSSVPPAVLQTLSAMAGYDRMLEMDRIVSAYGVSHAWLEQQLISSQPPQSADPNSFAPSSKEAPALPSSAPVAQNQTFRFEYDPSAGAAERRKSVEQAIVCPSCGVALGIPATRPIKVTCPQCLQETLFQA